MKENTTNKHFITKNGRLNSRVFVADFETTVFTGQTFTEVWAAAAVELFTENPIVWNDISGLWNHLVSLQDNIICYFHNLKFDGEFLLHYLFEHEHFKQALYEDEEGNQHFTKKFDLENKQLIYMISQMGQWYSITAKIGGKIIEFRDSLKLLPFSVEQIGKSFKTKHKKSKINYSGYRHSFGTITPKEEKYIKNDVLVPKEALELMYQDGHKKLTIGSCCWEEWKKGFDKRDFENWFPNLADSEAPEYCNEKSADAYVRHAYKGAWCYVAPDKAGKTIYNGCTFDVNSLYPSVMHSSSGNYYPIGKPNFWQGNYIPDKATIPERYYFIRVRTRFYLKPGKLPCIQIKNTFRYQGNEWLTTSDIKDENGQYHSHYTDRDGNIQPATIILTWTQTDYELIKEHYDLVDFEILDGCYFYAMKGLFDTYINKYSKIKMESKGAVRTEAKLFLNNLYGKLATNIDSSFKIAVLKDDGSMGYTVQREAAKQPGYIPCGAAVTSYARAFTIRAAQQNYYPDEPGFCYADTDSIHCDLPPEKVKGIVIHEANFSCWKNEAQWDEAHFVRQKTYMEHVIGENLQPIERKYWLVKCAGMPENCKQLFIRSMNGIKPSKKERQLLGNDKVAFLRKQRTAEDFTYGLVVPGKLLPVHYPGGIVLEETYFSMR